MSILGIDKTEFELNTLQGRRQALKKLQARGREIASEKSAEDSDPNVAEFFELLDAPLSEANDEYEAETPLDRVKSLVNILRRIDEEVFTVPPHPEIIEWRDIPEVSREWLIPNWLPSNTATMFTGDGGAGKSWLTLQVVCQIAAGFNNAFLDPEFPIPSDADDSIEPKHIVFATYEDEPAEIKRRIQALASGMKWIAESFETITQQLHIVDMRGIGSVWGPGMGSHVSVTGDLLSAGEELRTLCEEQNARLLVLDPLSGAFGGNENDRTAVYDFVSSFRGWGDTAKCAMLAIGHLPKGSEGRAAGFSGSTAWEASARSMWKIEKVDPDGDSYWILRHTKSNYARLQEKKYLAKSNYGWWFEVKTETDAIVGQQEYEDHFNKESNNGTPDTPNF